MEWPREAHFQWFLSEDCSFIVTTWDPDIEHRDFLDQTV